MSVGPSAQMSSAAPLKTTGKELLQLLTAAGRVSRGSGLEKLELLDLLTDQIAEKIEKGQRMHLKLSALQELLRREGLDSGKDAIGAVRQLLLLRSLHLQRLGKYVIPKTSVDPAMTGTEAGESPGDFLTLIPNEKVRDCFELDSSSVGPSETGLDVKSEPARHPQDIEREAAPTAQNIGHPGGSPSEHDDHDALTSEERQVQQQPTSQNSRSAEARLKTTGSELRQLLIKSGRAVMKLGTLEKLELLDLLTGQVSHKIEVREKMPLKVSELQALLRQEGMPAGKYAKEAVQHLLELRRTKLEALGTYVLPRDEQVSGPSTTKPEHMSSDALVLIPNEVVQDCFAAEEGPLGSMRMTPPAKRPLETPALTSEGDSCALPSSTKVARTSELEAAGVGKPHVQALRNDAANLSPELKQLAAEVSDRDVAAQCEAGECMAPRQQSLEQSLSKELQQLIKDWNPGSGLLALDEPEMEQETQAKFEGRELHEHRKTAEGEIDRILGTRDITDVLGKGSLEHQRSKFRQLAKLLHPDRGVVSGDRANLALRLAVAALQRARKSA